MRDEIFHQTKNPVCVACFVLVCVQLIPSVSSFYLNIRSESGLNVLLETELAVDAIDVTSTHSSVDQSDKRELLRKLDDLRAQMEARASNADSELKQIKIIEAETRKLIGSTTSRDQRELLDKPDETMVPITEHPVNIDTDSQTEQITTTTEPDKKDLIERAVWDDDERETEILINKYYEHDVNGDAVFLPISVASEKCSSVKVAKMLIRKGADVNVVGVGKWRPLHVATYADCRPIVKMLIEHGADLNAEIGLGYTALRIATQDHRENVIDLLQPSDPLRSIGQYRLKRSQTEIDVESNRRFEKI